MKSYIYPVRSIHENKRNQILFERRLIVFSFLFYVLLDSLSTFIGVNYFGLFEENPFLSFVNTNNAYWIVQLLLLKVLIHAIGSILYLRYSTTYPFKVLLILGIIVTCLNTIGIIINIGLF